LNWGFIKTTNDPGQELVFKRHFMNCKHWGELIDERYFKEVAKLSLIFVNSKGIPPTNHVFPVLGNDLILPGQKCVPIPNLDGWKVLRQS
jgi:hypothetical protein